MTDRELLELAAKAAGYEDWKYCEPVPGEPALYIPKAGGVWMPLHDYGDAMRLAVTLRMEIDHNHPADHTPWVSVRAWPVQQPCSVEEFDDEGQRGAATLRAITRAAAEIQLQRERNET